MKALYLIIATAVFVFGCDRPASDKESANHATVPPEHSIDRPLPNVVLAKEDASAPSSAPPIASNNHIGKEQVEARARELIARDPATGELSKERIAALIELVPKLQAHAVFWKWVGVVPPSQLGLFRDAILSSLKALNPTRGQPVDSQFQNAYNTAKSLRDPEVANIALAQLPLVETYRFPETPPPNGWPEGTPENLKRLYHGDQGVLASIVVELSDRQTLSSYRDILKTADPLSQRTLIWALGRSPELEDFDLLMSLRAKVVDPGTRETLVRALNRIPRSMESAAKYPETVPTERRPRDVERLLQTASQCKARLVEHSLVVEPTMYD